MTASDKTIRFIDLTELTIHNISESGDNLTIDFTGKSMDDLITAFKKSENIAIIQYYVGFDLVKSFADFVVYVSAVEKANQLISIDYATTDSATESGFAETRSDIQTVIIRKKTLEERIAIVENAVGV